MHRHPRPAGNPRDPDGGEGDPDASSRSSSIGKNSDAESGSGVEDAGESEAQSAFSGAFSMMNALEESLPIRRGISSFYCGKSLSFTSLADAVSSSSSVKDLAKPENAYSRKRRNLLAFKNFFDGPHNSPLRSTGGGVCKRPATANRSTLALAVTLCSSGNNSTNVEEEYDRNCVFPSLNPLGKPAAGPILGSSSPRTCTLSLRSFSLTDLQSMAGCSSSTDHRDKHKGFS